MPAGSAVTQGYAPTLGYSFGGSIEVPAGAIVTEGYAPRGSGRIQGGGIDDAISEMHERNRKRKEQREKEDIMVLVAALQALLMDDHE